MDAKGTDTYYDILQVSPNATEQEIQKAYRRLAKILHPDVCHEPDAEELFKTLNEAYSILSDPEKRTLYDATMQAGYEYYTRVHEENRSHRPYYERYQDPSTWYYKDRSTYHKKTQYTDTQKQSPPEPGKTEIKIPRWVQYLLFLLTLVMAVIIISQLLILPVISGYNQEGALSLREKGDLMFGEREYLLAIQYYTGYLETFPEDTAIWSLKGQSEMMKGDELVTLDKAEDASRYYREAVSSFLQAYNHSGGDTAILQRAGEIYVRMEDWTRAEEIYTTIISQHPDQKASETLRMIKLRKTGYV